MAGCPKFGSGKPVGVAGASGTGGMPKLLVGAGVGVAVRSGVLDAGAPNEGTFGMGGVTSGLKLGVAGSVGVGVGDQVGGAAGAAGAGGVFQADGSGMPGGGAGGGVVGRLLFEFGLLELSMGSG